MAAWHDWTLHDPAWLVLLALLPLMAWLRSRRGQSVLVIPFVSEWSVRETLPRSQLPILLMNLGLVALTFALARPQRIEQQTHIHQQGYDLVLAIDLSGSMLAEDYARQGQRINRLGAIKPIIEAFMARRPDDRIGVVTFAGRAYTLAPLSFDHSWLRRQIGRLRVGLIEDGTALGDALALAVARLGQNRHEQAGKRLGAFIILLTDGANNAGTIDPLQATRLARAKGIPVYTIGAGREGVVPMPVFNDQGEKLGYRNVRADLDEAMLQRVAAETGGMYYRAMDSDTIDAAFADIDRTRKIEFEAKTMTRASELFPYVTWPGLGLCLLAFWLARPGSREENSG